MKLVDGGACDICGKGRAVIICDGCGKKLCTECRRFEIWSYGCGHGDTKAFCERCFRDPSVNTWLQG